MIDCCDVFLYVIAGLLLIALLRPFVIEMIKSFRSDQIN